MNKALLLALIFSFTNPHDRTSGLPAGNYDVFKISITQKRKDFKAAYDSAGGDEGRRKEILQEAGFYLKSALIDTVFPHWYNTPWDFNGYTDKPREGEVACGYFVSTPLKHCGFNLNRFKLAQKYSFDIVKILSSGDSVKSYRGISAADFIAKTRGALKNGLYVVGLDFHVGFLLYEKDEVFFIHSNYRPPVAVVREKALESVALNDSKVFILCNITENERLIKKWLLGSEIIIQ